MGDVNDNTWIRPKEATETRLEKADRVVVSGGIRYAVKRSAVTRMSYDPSEPVPGVPFAQVVHGPFRINELCVGRVFQEDDKVIDADWYFELF
jgi:hypothetical protein